MKNKKIDNKNLYGFTMASDAVEDYLAVRTLLDNDHFLTALQLSTTAVEKLFKSFINLMYHEKYDERIHKPHELYVAGQEYFKQYDLEFDTDFLIWLGFVYSSRYSSNLYPGKEITFGELYLLLRLENIFERMFTFFKQVNEELSILYWGNDKAHGSLKLNANKSVSATNQRVISFLFIDGRKIRMDASLTTFNPKNPFIFRDAVEKDGNLCIDLDIGEFSPLDLPPSYYSSKF